MRLLKFLMQESSPISLNPHTPITRHRNVQGTCTSGVLLVRNQRKYYSQTDTVLTQLCITGPGKYTHFCVSLRTPVMYICMRLRQLQEQDDVCTPPQVMCALYSEQGSATDLDGSHREMDVGFFFYITTVMPYILFVCVCVYIMRCFAPAYNPPLLNAQ